MSTGKFVTGLLIGAAVGAGFALAYAPGEEPEGKLQNTLFRIRNFLTRRSKATAMQVKGAVMQEAGRIEQHMAEGA